MYKQVIIMSKRYHQNRKPFQRCTTYIIVAVIPLDGQGAPAKGAEFLKDFLEVL